MKENEDTKISKQEKMQYILETIKNKKITNYELEQHTGISQSGLGSITSGKTKNPRPATINTLYDYLKQRDENDLLEINKPANSKDNDDAELEGKTFFTLSIDEKLSILFDQNKKIIKDNEKCIDLLEKLSLSNQISFAPILRHFKLKKDTVPSGENEKKSIS